MACILFLLFVVLYYDNLAYSKNKQSILLRSFPVIIYWILIVGGQYYVGSDYPSYIEKFNYNSEDYFIYRNEYVFAYLITLCHKLGIYGQGIYFVLALIWIIILLPTFYFLVDKKMKGMALMFFLFIVYSTAFNNQMNGVRQYLAIYFYSAAICFFLNRNYLWLAVFMALAVFSHKSTLFAIAITILVFVFMRFVNCKRTKILYGVLIISAILSVLMQGSNLLFDSVSFLEEEDLFHEYTAHFAKRDSSGDILNLITKYIYIPILCWASYLLKKMKLSDLNSILFVFGIFSFSIKLSILGIPYIGRIGEYFEIFMCVPLVHLMIYLLEKKRKAEYVLLVLYLFLPYLLKVTIFAAREYDYKSIYFQ